MIRAAAEAGLANTPRAWVAPLAAAAAVVVVGGGIALATARGGGTNANGGAAGGPGVSTSTGADANALPCAPLGSGEVGVGVVVEGSAVPGDSGEASGIYTAVNEATSAPDLLPPPATSAGTAGPGRQPPTASPTSAPAATASDLPLSVPTPAPDGTISAVAASGAASEPVELTPSGRGVICVVGTATPAQLCSEQHHSVTCLSTGDCTTAENTPSAAPTSSDGPYSSVLCIDAGSGSYAPLPPTMSGSGRPVIDNVCHVTETCLPTAAPSAAEDSYTIDTKVSPGDSGTFDGPDIPAGQVLDVTALIFQNPAADEGTLTIEGDAAHRLTQSLSNFRDLDMHFTDQPLTYDATHPLRVTVDCANTSTACTPAVLVVGHLEQH